MNFPWRDGNRVELLINGEEYFPRLFQCIAEARREILLETFIIFEDEVGRQLQEALSAAAERGVEVQVTVDGYGTASLSTDYLARLTAAGVRVHLFDPRPRLLGMRTNLFRRLHRKLVVIDRRQAFVGGINYGEDHLVRRGNMAKQDYAVRALAPVVEVAGDHHRLALRQARHQLAEQLQLALALRLAQSQVHADRVQRTADVDHRMQQAAFLVARHRDVEVAVGEDRMLGEHGIAMVAFGIHRVAPVGELRPHAVGQILVLRRRRPGRQARGVQAMGAEDLLEEHQVGTDAAHRFAQLRQDEAPIERVETLVGVHRQHLQARQDHAALSRRSSGNCPGTVRRLPSSSSSCRRRRAS